MLNGSGYDAEDDVIISYTWFDNSDDSIVCSNTANEQDCIIDKPEGEHCFTYENTDIYGAQGTDVVCYYVREYDLNTDPISDAGSDQCVDEGSPIILDGCNSHDLEDCNLEYKWFKGDTIISNQCTAIDVAQNVDENSPEFNTYTLVVTDPYGNTNSDNVTVQIDNINVAPEIVNISDDLI